MQRRGASRACARSHRRGLAPAPLEARRTAPLPRAAGGVELLSCWGCADACARSSSRARRRGLRRQDRRHGPQPLPGATEFVAETDRLLGSAACLPTRTRLRRGLVASSGSPTLVLVPLDRVSAGSAGIRRRESGREDPHLDQPQPGPSLRSSGPSPAQPHPLLISPHSSPPRHLDLPSSRWYLIRLDRPLSFCLFRTRAARFSTIGWRMMQSKTDTLDPVSGQRPSSSAGTTSIRSPRPSRAPLERHARRSAGGSASSPRSRCSACSASASPGCSGRASASGA